MAVMIGIDPHKGSHTAVVVRGPGAPDRAQFDHVPVALTAGPVSSSLASGVMMMPGLIVFTLAPCLPQQTASAITRSELPRLELRD